MQMEEEERRRIRSGSHADRELAQIIQMQYNQVHDAAHERLTPRDAVKRQKNRVCLRLDLSNKSKRRVMRCRNGEVDTRESLGFQGCNIDLLLGSMLRLSSTAAGLICSFSNLKESQDKLSELRLSGKSINIHDHVLSFDTCTFYWKLKSCPLPDFPLHPLPLPASHFSAEKSNMSLWQRAW